MRGIARASIAGLMLVLAGCRPHDAATTPNTGVFENDYVDVSQVVTYRLTHRTLVDLDRPADVLRVFHARPMQPAWRSVDERWITDPALEPGDAVWLPAPDGGSWWRWQRHQLEPGEYAFESRFDVVTARRELRTRRLQLTWDDVEATRRDVPPSQLPERLELPQSLQRVAREIRSNHTDPLDAVRAVTVWIGENIEYSVDVDYRPDDLAAIERERKGWCGHRATVFRALCQELGLPVREVAGFNTRNQEGFWDGRGDWNRHAWAEIWLPRAGWVEVEPAESETPFAIPPTYIKNPPELQSHAVWVRRDGDWSWHGQYKDTIRVEPAESTGGPAPRAPRS